MSLIDDAAPVRPGEALDEARLGEYLASHIPGLELPLRVRQFPAGFSNLSYLLTAGSTELVLRRPPIGTRPKSGHDMKREFRVLSALRAGFAECPRPLHYCADESVIGAAFYVVERIRGIILRRDYPLGLEATPALVRAQQASLIEVLARLHGLDYRLLGLADLGRPDGYAARQVRGWTERYAQARTADAPQAAAIAEWLGAYTPANSGRTALIHNDFKLDNVVFDSRQPAHLIGVLDWEMATIGDPLMDLGCSMAYWVEAGDGPEMLATRMLPTHLPGSLSRAEALGRYSDASGVPIDEFRFYRVFGLFRLAVIIQQIYYRYYHGQTKDGRFGALGPMAHVLVRRALAEMSV
jgi:aminoglycoside phosphotransferase (APT) family kinase protein